MEEGFLKLDVEQGCVQRSMAKNLVTDVEDIEVKLNDEEIGYTATALDDPWLVYFTYLHSVHKITINLGEVADRGPFPSTLVWFAIATVAVVAVAGITLFVVYRKARTSRCGIFSRVLELDYSIPHRLKKLFPLICILQRYVCVSQKRLRKYAMHACFGAHAMFIWYGKIGELKI